MGYITQPHTSAGRIPTDKGYRFYVDSLLDKYDLSIDKDIKIREDILTKELQLDKIFFSITRMLSGSSKYAGVMLTPSPDFAVVKRIELVPIDSYEILLILITRTGLVLNKKVIVSESVTQDNLYEYSKFLTGELCGYSLYQIRKSLFNQLRSDKSSGSSSDMALDIAQLALSESDESDLLVDGIENLLKIPEMVEEDRLNSLLHVIEHKDILRKILEDTMENDGIRILIGEEISDLKVMGCSMVSSPYKIGNKKVGVIGVIGPTRMDYEKVVPLVDYTGKLVSDLLTRMSK